MTPEETNTPSTTAPQSPDADQPIATVGPFRLIAFQAIDIASAMSETASRRVQQERARMGSVLPKVADRNQLLFPAGVGPFTDVSHDQNPAELRNRAAYTQFNKTVLSPAFLTQVVPEIYLQPNSSALGSATPRVRVGESCALHELIGGAPANATPVTFRECSLSIYDDGTWVLGFEFTGDGMAIDSLAKFTAAIPRLTQIAAGEKLSAVLRANATDISPLAESADDFVPDLINDPTSILRRYGCAHVLIVTESMRTADGAKSTHEEIASDPALAAVLRRTNSANDYREQELKELRNMCLGYKSDELYATVRGTTLVVAPGHWDPTNFLSMYIEDLITLFSFTVSRVSLIDFTTHQTQSTNVRDVEPGIPPETLVDDILLLRRLLLVIDESLNIDLWVNHYFTRLVLIQLQQQRGLSNKLSALRKRIDSLDGILNVAAQSRLAGKSLAATIGQLRIAIIALVITGILSCASIVISLVSYLASRSSQ